MKLLTLMAFVPGLLMSTPCPAQLAAPQWRQPGVDSTHVVGNAVRVLPEYPQPPIAGGDPVPVPNPTAPTSIAQLLQAFDGVTLLMPGNETRGAHGQLRVVITSARAQVQTTVSWNWYDSCMATAIGPSCTFDGYFFQLSPEGLSVVSSGCLPGFSGNAGGAGEFKWVDFVALGGLSGATKVWALQRSSFWSSCYAIEN